MKDYRKNLEHEQFTDADFTQFMDNLKQSKKSYIQQLLDDAEKMYLLYLGFCDPSLTINVFKATDSGRYGKAFELNTKRYINGKRGNVYTVSSKGKTDVVFKKLKYEIKCNCGELNDIEKNDFVIYTMDAEAIYDKPEQAHVIPANEFLTMLDSIGLIRYSKKSTSGTRKRAIQSYKNSKKKTMLLAEMLEQYPTLKEWMIK